MVQESIDRQRFAKGALTVSANSKGKVIKSQVMRAPTYDQTMARRQEKADMPRVGDEVRLTKGPVVDTAASISVVNRNDSKHLAHTSGTSTVHVRVAQVRGSQGSYRHNDGD